MIFKLDYSYHFLIKGLILTLIPALGKKPKGPVDVKRRFFNR